MADGPVRQPFEGAREFMRLFAALVARPRKGDRDLPMLRLVMPQDGGALLAALDDRLAAVPHALVDAAGADDVQELLRALCQQLAMDRFRLPPLRFRRFLLADWLTGHDDLSHLDGVAARRELARRLRARLGRWGEELLAEGDRQLTGPMQRLALWLWRLLIPTAVFRARVSGRIPGFGREFRWFMHQQYLAPRLSRTFIGFAQRLTSGPRAKENAEQVDKLLVHAFLEDLRRAYDRRRPWRLRGWRRTVYPVALLDDVGAAGAGEELLRLVNDVRNGTGQFDPLLIVAAGASPPTAQAATAEAQAPDALAVLAADVADSGLPTWRAALAASRLRRDGTTWQLTVTVPAVTGPHPTVDEAIVPARPRWWAGRAAVAGLVLALVAGVATVGAVEVGDHLHCFGGLTGERVSVRLISGSCVGFSDSRDYVFSSGDVRLREAQERIFDQNRRAEQLHDQQPARPFVSAIYLGQLTDLPSFTAQSEDLEGIAAAQRERLNENSGVTTAPLLRVIVANEGPQIVEGRDVVDMLRPVIQGDSGVVGAIGLDESRQATVEVIQELTALGLPILAPSLSADELFQASPTYFQIAPPNTQQAQLIAAYTRTTAPAGSRAYLYYHPDDSDLYTRTLSDDLAKALPSAGISVGYQGEWNKPAESAGSIARMCAERPTPTVFYAGRSLDFDPFITMLEETCGDVVPTVIADDSVNRYIADPRLREQPRNNRPLLYVAKSTLVSCQNRGGANVFRQRFFDLISARDDPWRPCAPDSTHPLGERAVLGYDASTALLRAVERLVAVDTGPPDPNHPAKWRRPVPVTPAAVWAQLRGMRFDGVTGAIDFTAGQEPKNKRLAIFGVGRINNVDAPPTMRFVCGAAADAEPESQGCPPAG
ncbi:hypothetical protein F0L68_26670 [Solihabitans fulvus]|uniref:ABC-type branched-chain amino acid transport system, substrate-binding protein n=1 Tax=Solihabitans fulvus TaxID=1892852 RepID=A0A5B2X0D0_9PSEU|nr:hypothetical protein [Solihabitans fulvus]KAA2256366.1 hypothetical protein F0L68_26670 [Solihabitans fulvus]